MDRCYGGFNCGGIGGGFLWIVVILILLLCFCGCDNGGWGKHGSC